ncbi:MAG: hypothetical protein O7C75_10370 [Verrucomicrobia bacterium]|nr:hypothetical protein [Verrucomicrobiota bacterium]
MFIGHFGIGLGVKALDQRISLGTLFLAAQFVDLLWPSLLLLGVETVEIEPGITKLTPLNFVSYPISHSLLMTIVWGLLFGLTYWQLRKNLKGALILGLCVLTHWFLDFVVHRPDLPLHPGESLMVGLGLWNSVAGTLVVEGLLFVIGILVYLRVTKAKNRAGVLGFWGLIAFLTVITISNFVGPPPPSATAVAWVSQAQWILIIWAYWIDMNRQTRVANGTLN